MKYLFLCLSFLFAPLVYAEKTLPQPTTGQLENGLRYIILPLNEQKDRINVIMRVYAGAIDETENQLGGAHIVEHMAFRASQKHPDGVMPYLHSQGWLRGKNYNAYTNHDHTTYIYLPPQNFGLENTFDVMREMLFYADVSQTDLDDERKIVLEEWRTRDSVRRRLWEKQINSARVGSRYVNHPVIGTAKSITEMQARELQDYYKRWYVPNNMQLLVAGDVNIDDVKALINRYFAAFPAKTLLNRDNHYEPRLENVQRIDLLQDEQNNRSQVSFLWRFDDTPSQAQNEQGFYQRLVDQLTLSALNQRFRDEKSELPSEISAIAARKNPIGKKISALTINANVEKTAHHQGLQFILREIERFKKYPITQTELDKQKAKIRDQLNNERQNEQNYQFDDWVQLMINTLLNEKSYYPQAEIESLTLQGLEKITLTEINQRLQFWLNSADRIAQYMPPFNTQIETITPELIAQWQNQQQTAQLLAPKGSADEMMNLPKPEKQGTIVQETRFDAQNVVRWTLSNGDQVVWLKLPLAKNKSYFVAQSNAGSHSEVLTNWQSKFAISMMANNGPLHWSRQQMQEWKERQHIPLVMRQNFAKLNLLSTVDNEKLGAMLRFYLANQTETSIKEEFAHQKTELIRQIGLNQQSTDFKRNLAWENFVYGKALNPQPSLQAVEQLDEQSVMAQWQAMVTMPVTYFIVNNMDEGTLKNLIVENLANIPRSQPSASIALRVQAGSSQENFAMNPEQKDNVYLSLMSEMEWDAKTALTAELLTTITSEKLGKAMRDEALGVYGVRFRTRLSDEAKQLQTTLSFSANPTSSTALLTIAKNQLANLAETISQAELDKARKYLLEQRENAAKTPDYWLSQLIFSETHFKDPRYLAEENTLLRNIALADLQKLAKAMYNEQNQRLFITTPKQP